MDTYEYSFKPTQPIKKGTTTKVGVAGSGNLEVIIKPNPKTEETQIVVHTTITGFKPTWDELIKRFIDDHTFKGLHITINDAGATPPVVALRLGQAIETYQSGYHKKNNYTEAYARHRIYSLVDDNSFKEFLLDEDTPSPTLPELSIQIESDDGIMIGMAAISGIPVAIASQQKDFIGGSVGEVHGAKFNGLIQYAIKQKLPALVFLIDSGGVRLQEANIGEIEISEIIRSILAARSAGIKTIGVICGNNGAFGGLSIISGTLDYLIVNQGARIGISGAEVIEAVQGAEVLDSKNRPLIWRIYGGRTRYLQGAVQGYTSNKMGDIRQSIIKALNTPIPPLNFDSILAEHHQLQERIQKTKGQHEEGEWLKHHEPEVFQQDPFTCSDEQFMSLAKKRST